MAPIIGVLPLYNNENQTIWINPLYFGGIETMGATPVLLPLSDDETLWEGYCQTFDGFVFTGGQDVDPALYGQEKLPQCGYQAEPRDKQEYFMLRRLYELDKPVLGICRGCQILNVALGGTLYQDLPTQHPSGVVHAQPKPFAIPHHQVEITSGSTLSTLIPYRHLSVNSMHHQAILDVAPGLVVNAVAPDGIVEAVDAPDKRFFMGIQWHPEHLWQDYDSAKHIWQGFVRACKS